MNYNGHVTVNADFVDNRYNLKNDFFSILVLHNNLENHFFEKTGFYWLSEYQALFFQK